MHGEHPGLNIVRYFSASEEMVFNLWTDAHRLAEPGERVVICAGAPLGIVGVTNSLSVHTVGKV